MTPPPLYILRHGETEWNLSGRLQGHLDSPLTDKGIAQARMQRDILATQDLTGFAAISSPQGRAQETARLALEGLVPAVKVAPALSEIGIGDWAGRIRADLMAETGAPDGFALYELAPGGEGFDGLRQRCEAFLGTLQAPAILITHGITSRMLRLVLTGEETSAIRDIGGGQGVVYHVENGQQQCLTLGG